MCQIIENKTLCDKLLQFIFTCISSILIITLNGGLQNFQQFILLSILLHFYSYISFIYWAESGIYHVTGVRSVWGFVSFGNIRILLKLEY